MTNFRTAGAWGAGLGRNLTPAEVDTNFYGHDTRILALEDNPAAGIGISNITVSGNQVMFFMSDATTFGPFNLPYATIAVRSGVWQPTTAYFKLDLIEVSGFGFYLVLQDHTSAATFDPDRVISSNPVYRLVIPSLIPALLNRITATTYTVTALNRGKYLRFTAGAGCVITLPASGLSDGDEVHCRAATAGALSFVAASGATLAPPAGDQAATSRYGAVVTAKWCETEAMWDLFGDLAAVI